MQHRQMWTWIFWTVLAFSGTNHVIECVIRGSDAAEGYFPWAAAIEYIDPETGNYTACGATIISDRWMITAAHCFRTRGEEEDFRMVPEYWHAQVGGMSIEIDDRLPHNDGTIHADNESTNILTDLWDRIKNIHSHGIQYDIALIKISSQLPINERNLSIAGLPKGLTINQWPPIDSLCTFVGWGGLGTDGGESKKAQVVSLKVIQNPECPPYFNELIAAYEFCAGYSDLGVSTYYGDSGSGLMYMHDRQPFVVGILSGGPEEYPESYPSIFIRVASFTDWITETIEDTG